MIEFWSAKRALIYSILFTFLIGALFLLVVKKPTGLLDARLASNKDLVVMATDAPDYIQLYSPATMISEMYPSDERLNDAKIDKAGKRIFVVNKEGWLNIFYLHDLTRSKIRRKLGDVLQSVAVSGDERYLAVGIGSSEDYNARDINVYSLAQLEEKALREVYPFASIPMRGDIQAIISNPNPSINRGYIISSQNDKLSMFDFATGQRIGFIELGNSPAYFKIRPDGLKGYGSINARESLVVVDFTKGKERTIGHIKMPSAPYYLAYNREGNHLYVGSRDRNEVYVVDTRKDELIETLRLANPLPNMRVTTELIAVSTDENYLYVIPRVGLLLVYEITHDGSILKPVQSKNFPKEPSMMDVIRPD